MKSSIPISEAAPSNRTRLRRSPKEPLSKIGAGVELWFVLVAVLGAIAAMTWSVVWPV